MKTAIYPGTFDPPTVGHLDLIQRAAGFSDRLIVAVGENFLKGESVFSVEERVEFLRAATAGMPQVEVSSFRGLLVDFAKSKGVHVVIRAIRTVLDFESETLQAHMNRELGGLETVYLAVSEKYRLVSSTLIREIAAYGRRLDGLVPQAIEEVVFQRLHAGGAAP